MENLKIFLDHLCFSIICTGVGAMVLYVILYGIGAASAITNHLPATGISGVLSLGSALLFTYQTIKNRAGRPIIYTRRQN
jgi:hypothetical protein